MARPVEDVPRPPRLHDPAGVHDGHAVAQLGHDAEVVRDEDHGEARLALDVLQEAQVLGLDGHVERRGGLVGDEQARLAGDGDGPGHPLADAAAHLVGIGDHAALGVADAHLAQQLGDARVEDPAAQPPVQAQRLCDLLPHRQRRIERRHGVLQDHGDARASQLAHRLPALGQEILALEQDLPTDDAPARLRHKPQDGQARHGLARSRLANDPQGLAAPQGEIAPSTALTTPRRV